VHEIASGTHSRPLAIADRSAWAAACSHCNCHLLTDKSKWPIARQLAVKLVYDPQHFDAARVNVLRGRAAGAVTLADVAAYLTWS